MNLSAMQTFDDTDVVDAVVIGTGAGGAPLLAVLAERGLRVVALEAGGNVEPHDHTPDETAAAPTINWMEERLSGGDAPTAFGPNNSGRGVGGSTLHWGAYTPRPDRADLMLRSDTGLGADWPIQYGELVGYVEQVERFIGVSGPADYPWDPGRKYYWPPVGRNAAADVMMKGCSELRIRAADAPAAVLSADHQQDHWGLRHACVNCGACHQGCRNAAKAGTDITYLPRAVAAGAEIRPDSVVTGIECDAGGRVDAVVYVRDGVEHRQRCANLFVCAGGVETPRLLLHTGLANSSGEVGRNFMAHGAVQVWGKFDTPMRAHRGFPSALITEDFRRPENVAFGGGYLIQSLGVMPQTWATSLARGGGLWGAELVRTLTDYPYVAGLGINGECLPSPDNALTLAGENDEYGVPKASVTFSPSDNEQAIEAHATQTMTAIMRAAGGRDLTVLPRTAHTIGTCRMGTDREHAVVDADGRSFDVPNLWVCDNSVFPSSLIANPALTIMALSLRTADRFLRSR